MPTGYDYVALKNLAINNVLAFTPGMYVPDTTVTSQGWVVGVDVAAPGPVNPTPQLLTDQNYRTTLDGTYVAFGPTLPTLTPGTEYVWNKTDGAGTLIDIISGVA